ncbi:putative vitamin K epoxide reductase complex subunit 1 [Neospora caninum Liverpool]|uniref:vitamin-K-epoxide reductase (warfarin-sensitive) n=1 Tax=Neospora caninum (strain Liverpool) TaxID=572307 RepID=F0VR16_NEOCL|nr:putative vitamin K epoxide reductase complex subunit 1 [Neospora caninum Liverpool]CBZ56163.1 putative vitamin K epoxide reductase complex subunit 1 [Neospora caninum Liverpool]CEL70920.1 TPA: vitamin K epoxide reductase complex subunit 1,putative [Neospora caninum Liverpool]|eukprot:XP_003886189.1 putative vitamin K epoxide reductase complex subunit 1 [Neospora caninum Liverpool]
MAGVNFTVVVTSALGVALCLYAINVEQNSVRDATYRAFCDFSPYASCSKVLTSTQSRLLTYFGIAAPDGHFDFPNTYLGLFFYAFMLTFPRGRQYCHCLYTLAAAAAMASSIYLAYVLYAVLHDFCLVCVTSYVLNLILLAVTLFSRSESRQLTPAKRRAANKKKIR